MSSEPSGKKPIDSRAVRSWAFAIGDRRSSMVVYRLVRRSARTLFIPLLRLQARNTEVLNRPGPTILAPVHRSHLDSIVVATLSTRRIRALGKESLFTTPVVRYFCAALGAIPVRRGAADREALAAARLLLERGESMIVFPEGTRQDGHDVGRLFDGAAWLSARTGARVVPIGISGTGAALPEGARFVHRARVGVVVGDPIDPPVGPAGKRATREQLREFTEQLGIELQRLQDEARDLAG